MSKRYHQAILLSCEIPWDEKEELIEKLFREEIRAALTHGFKDIYVFGTAGEGYAVDTRRFQQIVEIFREETADRSIFPQVGVIGLSTANVVERLEFAYNQGFRIFQISLPSWGALNDREVLKFFRDVCGTFPEAKFLHYNLPRTKRVLTASDYRPIVDAVPNLVATKNTGTNVNSTADLIRITPELQHFLGEALFPIGCLHGECSLLSSFGAMIPSKTKEFFELGKTRQIEKLFLMHKDYLSMVGEILQPMLGEDRIDGAYDKMLVRLGGLNMPLRLLSPYESLSEEIFEECSRILHEKYPEWIG